MTIHPRKASQNRKTAETAINVSIDLDGNGTSDIATGIPFFDHMLTLLCKHSLMDLTVKAEGDIDVDAQASAVTVCPTSLWTKHSVDV